MSLTSRRELVRAPSLRAADLSLSHPGSFTTFNDDYVIQRAITGFRQCATLAGKFHMPEVFDHIVMALSQSELSL